MNVPTFAGLCAALSIAAVAGVYTWHSLQASPGAATDAAAADLANDASRLEVADLRARIAELEAERAAAAAQRTIAPLTPAEDEVVEPPPPPPAEAKVAACFLDPRFADVLAKIDWATMGAVTKEMQPLLAELVKKMQETGEVPLDLAAKIQALNSKLVAQVPAMMESGAPGFGPNGSYTHPLFVANTLAATLAASGQQLDPKQQAALDGLVRSFSAENDAIVAAARDFDVEHLLAEAEMKDRFFAEMTTRLTAEQQASLFPADMPGYDGINLFSASLMTRPYTAAIPAKDPIDFARLATNRIGEELGLDDATSAKVRGIVEAHAKAATDLWETPADKTETTLRMLRTGRTSAAMRHQIAMLRAISQQVDLTPAQRDKLKGYKQVLVPLPKR
jgi:hypothetical protein